MLKMTILRLLGSSDDKEKIGVARPKGPPLRGFRYPVVAHKVGKQERSWNRPIWVPKDVIINMKGTQMVWVPKET